MSQMDTVVWTTSSTIKFGETKKSWDCEALLCMFEDGKPTQENPDPIPALPYDRTTPARLPPKVRALSEPPRKRLRLENNSLYDRNERKDVENNQNISNQVSTSDENSECGTQIDQLDENRLLDMLALAAENESLKQQLAKLILENENLMRKQVPAQADNAKPKLSLSAASLRENKKKR